MAGQGFLATSLGFIPSFIIMYYVLVKYDRFFDDRRVVILYGVGMVFGTIVAVFHAILSASGILLAIDLSILVFALVMPLFTELGKQTILGHRKLRLKYDTALYGGALGAGIGALLVISRAYQYFYAPGLIDQELYKDPVILLSLLMYSLAICGIHTASGVVIGIGSSKGDFWPYLLRALMMHMAFNLLLLPYEWNVSLLFLGGAMLYALFVVWYVIAAMLPESIPEDIHRKIRRERRKMLKESNAPSQEAEDEDDNGEEEDVEESSDSEESIDSSSHRGGDLDDSSPRRGGDLDNPEASETEPASEPGAELEKEPDDYSNRVSGSKPDIEEPNGSEESADSSSRQAGELDDSSRRHGSGLDDSEDEEGDQGQ